MNWINPNTLLKGEMVELHPLEVNHFEEIAIMARENKIWEFMLADMSTTSQVNKVLANAMLEKEKGSQVPFVIYHKQQNKIIGSTRLLEIYPAHKKLEIGWTWLHPDYWATAVNLECKLLLLTFCFEELKTIRVQLRTDVNNIRSQKAIQKIGAQFEGIVRHDLIRENGTIRNSAYFSLINTEWENAKENLTALLNNKRIK